MNKHSFSYENPLRIQFKPDFFKLLPERPGVYFMMGPEQTILYIGKAKSLKSRLSCYSYMKPGRTEDRILEMLEQVKSIDWEEHASESEALLREAELLRAIRPPYNIAGTHEATYLFIGIKRDGALSSKLEFRLSNYPEFQSLGFEVHGCYRHRSKIKVGYSALLRLIYAATLTRPRFSYPAKISRMAPPWLYEADFPENWDKLLSAFLSGHSDALLHEFMNALLLNENIPRFMRPSLQDDIETVKALYRLGPQNTFELKKRHGLRAKVLTPQKMNLLLQREIKKPWSRKSSSGDQGPSTRKTG
jgi:excinuclease UvrABC nuclease subunit